MRLPDTATVLVHDTTDRIMWRRVTRVPPSTGTGSAKPPLQRVCCGPMEGRRHSMEGPFSGLRTHWRAEPAEAASSVVGGGNSRSVSHVSHLRMVWGRTSPSGSAAVGQSRVEWSRSSRAVRGLLRGCSRYGVGRSHSVSAGTQARRNCNQSCFHWPEAFGGLAFILSDVRQRWPLDCPKLSVVVAGRGGPLAFSTSPPQVASMIVTSALRNCMPKHSKTAVENLRAADSATPD